MNQNRRNQIFEQSKDIPIYLDDVPAVLRGRLLDFPHICTDTRSIEYSWPAIERIINKDGRFKS